jgi:glycosyltransferase involved in cell wall biosynthesis
MNILFTCGREPGYIRNKVVLTALRASHTVTEVTDEQPGSLTARSLRVLLRLIPRLKRGNYDLVFVGFYGYLLMPFVRRVACRPIVFDAFVSNYDTLCFDRKRFRPRSIVGRLAFWLDRIGCNAADKVVLDTKTHRAYFAETFKLPANRLSDFYIGCDEGLFFPRPASRSDGEFRVLHYSSSLPIHGVEHIVTAAGLLRERKDLRFRLIGRGATHAPMRRLAERVNASNVEFLPTVPQAQLPGEIAAADLCLGGHFGDTSKARRVIAGKTFEFLAMARPVIASDTPGSRELVTHGQSAYLVPLADPEALAAAIASLQDDPVLRESIARGGYECYQRNCSEAAIRESLYGILLESAGLHQGS